MMSDIFAFILHSVSWVTPINEATLMELILEVKPILDSSKCEYFSSASK